MNARFSFFRRASSSTFDFFLSRFLTRGLCCYTHARRSKGKKGKKFSRVEHFSNRKLFASAWQGRVARDHSVPLSKRFFFILWMLPLMNPSHLSQTTYHQAAFDRISVNSRETSLACFSTQTSNNLPCVRWLIIWEEETEERETESLRYLTESVSSVKKKTAIIKQKLSIYNSLPTHSLHHTNTFLSSFLRIYPIRNKVKIFFIIFLCLGKKIYIQKFCI